MKKETPDAETYFKVCHCNAACKADPLGETALVQPNLFGNFNEFIN
jgi:hypothetical protein